MRAAGSCVEGGVVIIARVDRINTNWRNFFFMVRIIVTGDQGCIIWGALGAPLPGNVG